jgi:hypothetical protein
MISSTALIKAQWHLEFHTSSHYPFYFSNSGHSIPSHTSHHFSCFSYQKMSQYLCSSSTKAMVENGKQKTPEALATNITFVHPYGAGYPQTYQGTIPGVIACKLSYNSIPLGGLEGAG